MDINSLRIFSEVAKSGSVSTAARSLNYVQSNVSARLKGLEESLGRELFYREKKGREGRGMVLTPAGKTLLQYSDRIIGLTEEARRAVANDKPAGELVIGSTESNAAVRLPPVLSMYHKTFPDVELRLITGTSEELLNGVLDYSIDGAFVSGYVEHPGIDTAAEFPEKLVLLSPPEGTDKDVILVFRHGCTYRERLEAWMRSEGRKPVRVMEFGTIETILSCVAAGMGCSLFPESVANGNETAKGLRRDEIDKKYSEIPTLFIKRKNSVTTAAMKEFVAMSIDGCDK
ncbi:LysR family transcriptional regulator [Limisalsivibrio acetivorans]|uniref:LysR family transcriptional regulator n=1 Tax=Limisalsivibrio acetivorans TaxID=1304888 RepID=UPI0003B41BAE|nr:LysR family transcriptional regulator [Limisalsivibrio acetivorans]